MEKLFANVRAFYLLCLALGLFHVVVLAGLCRRLGAAMPQAVKGDGSLAVAFGDARETIGAAMVHKADSYFHGGIDMDCKLEEGHDGDEDDDGCGHGHAHGHAERHLPASGRDPWRWINDHVRAPSVHVHLKGPKAVETMPWLWAAVRADPKNAEAWTTAWYVANNIVRDRALAWRIVEEAKRTLPDSLQIALYEARHVYDFGRGDSAAAEKLFKEVCSKALARCGGDEAKLGDSDAEALRDARAYLGKIEKDRAK